jgi:hypothetical protein
MADKLSAASVCGSNVLPPFKAFDGCLQGFRSLVVVALVRQDRRVAEQIADLGERNVASTSREAYSVPQVVPMQVEVTDP